MQKQAPPWYSLKPAEIHSVLYGEMCSTILFIVESLTLNRIVYPCFYVESVYPTLGTPDFIPYTVHLLPLPAAVHCPCGGCLPLAPPSPAQLSSPTPSSAVAIFSNFGDTPPP